MQKFILKKRELSPHLEWRSWENLWADVVIAAHAMRENHYAIFAHLENFSGFHPQDKHNASYLFVCNG